MQLPHWLWLTLLFSNQISERIKLKWSLLNILFHHISSLAFLNRLGTSFTVSSLKRCLQVNCTFRNTLQFLAILIVYLVKQLAERSKTLSRKSSNPHLIASSCSYEPNSSVLESSQEFRVPSNVHLYLNYLTARYKPLSMHKSPLEILSGNSESEAPPNCKISVFR